MEPGRPQHRPAHDAQASLHAPTPARADVLTPPSESASDSPSQAEQPASRFAWPPRPLQDPAVVPPTDPQASVTPDVLHPAASVEASPSASQAKQLHAAEPSGPAAKRIVPTLVSTRAKRAWSAWASALTQLEDALFQPIPLTLAHRAREAGWLPDPIDAYCQRCGEPISPQPLHLQQTSDTPCAACSQAKLHWQRFIRLGTLDGPLRDWVYEVKFAHDHRLARELGQLLSSQIALACAPPAAPLATLPSEAPLAGWVAVPVPTTYRRRLARGIDHARQIALGVADSLEIPCWSLLQRAHGRPQRGLPRTERLRNARGRFQLRPTALQRAGTGNRPAPAGVLLIDDVRTTGATLAACTRELRQAIGEQTPIWVASLAIASPERDR